MTSGSDKALREVSDDLLNDLGLLSQLEERKRQLEPDDPAAEELARAVATVASRVLSLSISEEHITRAANEAASRGEESAPSSAIAEKPRSAFVILEDWRAAERRLSAETPGTADHAKAALDAERFRQEYQRRFSERQHDQ